MRKEGIMWVFLFRGVRLLRTRSGEEEVGLRSRGVLGGGRPFRRSGAFGSGLLRE
jgi:hypothetical protein